jgi:hypothetical protein
MAPGLKSLAAERRNKALDALKARADFKDVAGYADLTEDERLRLFTALLKAKEHFDLRDGVKAISKDSAATALLEKVEKSISRAAKFGDVALETPEVICGPSRPATPQGDKAFRLLEEAGEQWARQHREAGGELPTGFTPFGAASFIEAFLRAARVMESIVEMAKPKLEATPVKNFQNGPMEWLAGKKLPAVYSLIFQRDFTATAKTDTAQTSNGIKFVRAACIALGLPCLDDETIRSHCKAYRG